MGSYMNFKNFGEAPLEEGGERPPNGNFPLARQSSVYSLTLDEFHSTFNGFGKDFGSLNMDELLKNIWTAEETQAMAATASVATREGNNAPSGSLPRQGSLTLPRTLSQKTVDEVWKDLFQGSTSASANGGVSNMSRETLVQERQPTLGEITLEEFLSRAGVVREDTNPIGRPNNNGFISDLPQPNNSSNSIGRPNNNGFSSDLHQPNNSNHGMMLGGQNLLQNQQQQLLQPQGQFPQQATLAFGSHVPSASNGLVQGSVAQRDSLFEPVKVVSNAGTYLNQLPQDNVRKSNLEQVFPKQVNVAFAASVPSFSYEMKSPVVNLVDGALGKGNFTEKRPISLTGLVNEKPIVIKAGSPVNHFPSDRVANSNTDNSISPLPYMFNNGGVRERRGGPAMERATERRHKRMIKNRESAARSRARKQAYTLELEAEINKLKEHNQQLRKQQEEIIEMQKDKVMETVNRPWGSKRLSLRRTLTGPW